MIKFRLIARLDIKSPHLVKTVQLEGLRKLGDPAAYAERYDRLGVDELIYLDIVASLYGRNSLHDLVRKTTDKCFMPVTVGGGVRSVEDARALLRAGADAVAINTAAIKRPELLSELRETIGSQSVTLQLDVKRYKDGWQAWCEGGRENTGKDALEWAKEAVERGAGQVLVTSIDKEGTRAGPDERLSTAVAKISRVPVVYSGGIALDAHVTRAAQSGCSGVAMASLLHFNLEPLSEVRQALIAANIPTRLPIAADLAA